MRTADAIRRDNTTFVLLSFEGPDSYSRVGKLGERVTNLSETLANMGFETHLLFIGDPDAPGHETTGRGRLHLHRWCQWISRYHPEGAYQAEDEKLWDLNGSAPSFVVNEIVKRSALNGKFVVVQGEEWHSAEAVCSIADLVRLEGIEERVLTLWNANDVRSFDRIDWPRLARSASITTVSKYMKHLMWKLGVNALVIPNGIPRQLLLRTDERRAALIKKTLDESLLLVKIADWHPGKRWRSAIEAIASLKSRGRKATLIAAGDCPDDESRCHQADMLQAARSLGLKVADIECSASGLDEQISALLAAAGADVFNVNFPMSYELIRILYSVGDGVLADSDHEPFGSQAIEAMASGGVVFTGCTGEDFADPLVNAIVLETDDPNEIVEYALYLDEREDEKERIRQSGRATAQQHVWEEVATNLVKKVEYLQRAGATKRSAFLQVPRVNWTIPFPLSPSTVRSLYQPRGACPINAPASRAS